MTGMTYFKVAKVEEFENKRIKSLSILGKKIGIIKREDGSFYAIEVGCKHQGADITKGNLRNNTATCPRHKWKYNLETGECLNHESQKLRKHDLKVVGKNIKISLTPLE